MIVLDTHALVWAVQDDGNLGSAARRLIEDEAGDNGILIPVICAWEVALISSRGQVDLTLEPVTWMRRVLNRPGYSLAPLEPDIAVASVGLAWTHKDPADRIIVATAQYWAAPLLTADAKILAYAAAGHVQAIEARR